MQELTPIQQHQAIWKWAPLYNKDKAETYYHLARRSKDAVRKLTLAEKSLVSYPHKAKYHKLYAVLLQQLGKEQEALQSRKTLAN